MKVIVMCEFSGTVRDAFARRGHDAWSCDLLPSDTEGQHIQADAMTVDVTGFDLAICHPPCTYLCNSGVCHLQGNSERWRAMEQACWFFRGMLSLPVPMIAVENPIPHKYAVKRIGRKYDQIVHPWQFGHGESKATCLWLKGLPQLQPTNIVDGREQRLHRLPPSADRWKMRSKTYSGIADAMAEQWSLVAATTKGEYGE